MDNQFIFWYRKKHRLTLLPIAGAHPSFLMRFFSFIGLVRIWFGCVCVCLVVVSVLTGVTHSGRFRTPVVVCV